MMEFPAVHQSLELRAACRLVIVKLEEAGMAADADGITLAFAIGWAMRVLTDALDASEPSKEAASFTCPRCGRTSYNQNDIRERYCGACRDWFLSEPSKERP
jgi:hypothetical protein